jgi:trigger factor
MKTEFIDISDTQKNLVIEIPSEVVDAEIDRITRDYSRQAKLPGFRQGKVPAKIVRQRFRDQILHEVAHELIPRAVDEALRDRGVEPVDTPDIRDVLVEEGRPLKFTAAFETVPPIDPGDYSSLSVRRPPAAVTDQEVEDTLQRMRERAARYEAVEGRAVEHGDTLQLDLDRKALGPPPADTDPATAEPRSERHENISVDIGGPANPPGFDEELIGMNAGEQKTFTLTYPEDYAVKELAGTAVGSRRTWGSSTRSRRCGSGCATTCSTRRSTRRTTRCAPSSSDSSRRACTPRCRRRSSSGRSTGGSRSSSGG